MPDLWYYIDEAGQETGPLTPDDLAKMARHGYLTGTDRLRKEGTDLFVPAARVKGLEEMFSGTSANSPPMTLTPTDAENESVWSWNRSRFIGRMLAGISVIALVATVSGWMARVDPTFPEARAVTVDQSRVHAREMRFRAPIPRIPSLPGLDVGVAVPVPGLEAVEPAYSPTLSYDLKLIVFASMGPPGRGYELFEATRDSLDDDFSEPRLIASCSTPDLEAYPTLSPDGLEMLFVRGHEQPSFYFTSRTSRSEEFPAAVPWMVEEMNPEQLRLGRPQFVGPERLAYRRMAVNPELSETVICTRASPVSLFGAAEQVLFSDPLPQYFLAANRLRAYAGTDAGLFLTARTNADYVFPWSLKLLDGSATGAFDGPFWVAPKEDLVVYCSAGPGNEPGASRRLWMMRF